MDGRRILIIAVILVAGWWFWSHRDKGAAPAKSGGVPAGASTNAMDCVRAADAANSKLHDAAMLAGHPPVDASAWSSAQSDVSSAISSAESACGSPNTDADRKAAEEVKAALSLMRSTLSMIDAQTKGQSAGSGPVQNQEQIDAHLDKARGFARG